MKTLAALLVLPLATLLAAEPTPSASPAPEAKEPVEFDTLTYSDELERYTDPKTGKVFTGPIYTVHYNGERELTGQIIDGLESGLWTEQHDNGKPSSRGFYVDGKEDGWWIYFQANGQLESQGAYEAGRMVGWWRDYHPNGHIAYEGFHGENGADGDWYTYDETTSAITVTTFKDGKPATTETPQ